MFGKFTHLLIAITFLSSLIGPIPKAQAQPLLGLPEPGAMVNLSPSYSPALIKGVTVHKDNPFLFDFIVGVGQDKLTGEALKKESEKLVKYFLASLAIPEKDMWVNLSPYEKDRTIPKTLSQTEMGRDLLSQDYILKQLTASLIYPEKKLGKTFWDRVYAKSRQMYGSAQVPVNTFNKVWIMADKASVFERNQTAFVVESHLKVMLEEDYLALQKHSVIPAKAGIHSVGSQIVREVVLPELEKEINTGKNFSQLRQIFNSIILASWYKNNLKQAILNQVYADKEKVKGIALGVIPAKAGVRSIYQRYLQAYKKGVFNYIKEDAGAAEPRKYFSGGIDQAQAAHPLVISGPNSLVNQIMALSAQEGVVKVETDMAMNTAGNSVEAVIVSINKGRHLRPFGYRFNSDAEVFVAQFMRSEFRRAKAQGAVLSEETLNRDAAAIWMQVREGHDFKILAGQNRNIIMPGELFVPGTINSMSWLLENLHSRYPVDHSLANHIFNTFRDPGVVYMRGKVAEIEQEIYSHRWEFIKGPRGGVEISANSFLHSLIPYTVFLEIWDIYKKKGDPQLKYIPPSIDAPEQIIIFNRSDRAMRSKVTLTGATGFLGSALSRALMGSNSASVSALVLDERESKKLRQTAPGFFQAQGSLIDGTRLKHLLDPNWGADTFINLAADTRTAVKQEQVKESAEIFTTNVLGAAMALLTANDQAPAANKIFISSFDVTKVPPRAKEWVEKQVEGIARYTVDHYKGKALKTPQEFATGMAEDYARQDFKVAPYPLSKDLMDEVLVRLAEEFQIKNVLILRIMGLIGVDMVKSQAAGLLMQLVNAVKAAKEHKPWTNPLVTPFKGLTASLISVDDVVRVLLDLSSVRLSARQAGKPLFLDLGGPRISWERAVDMIVDTAAREPGIDPQGLRANIELGDPPPDFKNVEVDPDLTYLERVLGKKVNITPLEQAIPAIARAAFDVTADGTRAVVLEGISYDARRVNDFLKFLRFKYETGLHIESVRNLILDMKDLPDYYKTGKTMGYMEIVSGIKGMLTAKAGVWGFTDIAKPGETEEWSIAHEAVPQYLDWLENLMQRTEAISSDKAMSAKSVRGDYSLEAVEQVIQPYKYLFAKNGLVPAAMVLRYYLKKQLSRTAVVESLVEKTGITKDSPRSEKEAAQESIEAMLGEIDSLDKAMEALSGKKILVVDDDAVVADSVILNLEIAGVKAEHAPDVEAALQLIDKDPGYYDLVFTDMDMPGKSGLEMAKELRAKHPGLKIVMWTGRDPKALAVNPDVVTLKIPVLPKPSGPEKYFGEFAKLLALPLQPDRASIANPGGIDLNTRGMNWNIGKDGQGVEMKVDAAMLERIKREGIDGLTPVILRMTPIDSIWSYVK